MSYILIEIFGHHSAHRKCVGEQSLCIPKSKISSLLSNSMGNSPNDKWIYITYGDINLLYPKGSIAHRVASSKTASNQHWEAGSICQ